MDPNWAQKNPALPDAARAFPKRVFQEWLRLRRQGADQFFPEWRRLTDEQKRERVYCLDLGAVLKARFN